MRIYLSMTILFSFHALFAQWTAKNCFEPKVFVENKGQFSVDRSVCSDEILFGARQDGMHYYFTRNAVLIKRNEMAKREGEREEDEKAEFRSLPVEKWHMMKFMSAAQSVKVEAYQIDETKHHYGTLDNRTIVASAFKKIVYKDLYPNIDMEFEFPEDKQGFKYTFMVHPGGDAANIAIEYPLSKSVRLQNGNVIITSSIGDFVDHAPVSFQQEKNVASNFLRDKKNRVAFNVAAYDKEADLILDPWTSTPTFTGSNNAYDVDWDHSGNAYVYGGVAPFQVIKFNSAGSVLWTYTTAFAGGWYYGDFAVDKNSQSVYIVDGFNSSGAQIIKVNSAGTQVAINQGNSLLQELWRISFDMCNLKPVIAGGGTSSPSYTGCTLDTTLTTLTPVNVINSPTGLHDMWGLTLDQNGYAYFITAKTQVGSAGFDNTIYKVPNPSLTPIVWTAPSTYNFVEVASVNYAPGPPNGFNGAAVGDTNLFLYDSYVLTRFNSNTGALTGTLSVNGASQNTMTYGGLTADGCDNVYLGLNNTIRQYDASFNSIATYTMAGTVYDVSLGNGTLYACGMGWVSTVSVGTSLCNPCQGGTTNVSSTRPTQVKVYPNPVSDLLFIEMPSAQNASVEIINSIGQTVKKLSLQGTRNSISIKDLAAGVYSVMVSTGAKQIQNVIVKTNP